MIRYPAKQIPGHWLLAALAGLALACPAIAADDGPPIGPAETALFRTPHLHNIAQPETLRYRFEQTGGVPFTDKVDEQIIEIHADKTKLVNFDFLTGDHHEFYPSVDNFSGNPMLMVFLEHDVKEMKQQIGMSAAYFRDKVRAGFIDHATIEDTTYQLNGKAEPAQKITVTPFGDDERLSKLTQIRQKRYEFVLCDKAPGGLVELGASMPADPDTGAPAWSAKLTLVGVVKS